MKGTKSMMKEFTDWVKCDECFIKLTKKSAKLICFRVAKNDQLDFIFYQLNYNGEDLKMEDLKYGCIYNKADGQIYNAEYHFLLAVSGSDYKNIASFADVKVNFFNETKNKINAIISNNRANLKIENESEIRDGMLKNNLEYSRSYREHEKVRQLFLAGKTPADIVFDAVSYNKQNFSDEDYVQYITSKKDELIEKSAEQWIEKNQEKIFVQFLVNDIIKEELQAILDDKSNSIHIVKKIIEAVNSGDYKTVNVITVIDGKELTFKTKISNLGRDCESYYHDWDIVAADRGKFEDTYGRHSNYRPEQIIRITYGKQILYERT